MTQTAEQKLADQVAQAHSNGQKLRIIGGGTRQSLGNICDIATTVSTLDLNGISLYEPGALTVVAGAGTPVEDIEKALAAEGQRLPFEPMDHRGLLGSQGTPTIGGVVACNVSGPARIQVGSCRDSLIGVRMVDGTGSIIKNGGRVMKNVTGYDLVKLASGSFGTLGVLTEVAFKVLPASEATATIKIQGLGDEVAVATLSEALTAPYDVSGAAHITAQDTKDATTLIRLQGFKKSVAYRAEKLKEQLSKAGDISVVTAEKQNVMLWKTVRDVEAFHKKETAVWRISVAPSDGPKVAQALRDITDAQVVYDWGGGLVWASVPYGTDARSALVGIDGYAVCIRDQDTSAQSVVPQNAAIAKIEQGLRAKFDPKGILNTGIMG
ncbi:FAD-binding protein [Amylibacter sp. SFDW26]|uniref:FAD-binding protein n=1 Tax=Amylibacter sp. SFDW26 TaxID=2652722 RepID=UPI001261AFCD|nr:FAD-binding protein [Amylibacter sp. SFDW26]KAB7613873.1 FAD-binding protein [Amylibacter sp. SFDW26]